MDFNVNDWLGDWISFEHLINNHDPNLDRAWKDSTKAMRSKPLFAIMMLGDARRFWAKACYVFHASDAGASDPFAVLIAMEPMPERSVLRHGGLLSHLHFQYASDEGELIKGTGKQATLRHRMWYPTMCAAEGTLLDQCNIVRALHHLQAWRELPVPSSD